VFVLTVMDSVAKEMSQHHSTLDVVSIRYVSGLFWSGLAALFIRPPMPDAAMVRAHSIRAIFFGSTSFLFFYALKVLPIVETLVFTYVSPIFMALLGWIVLKEKVPKSTAIAIVISFVGVLVIAGGKNGGSLDISADLIGIFAALGSSATYALSMVLLRARTGTDAIATIVVLQTVLTSLLVLPLAFYFGDPIGTVLSDWPLALLFGLLGTGGQFAMATALRSAPAARIGVVDYTSLVWASLFGMMIFGEWPGVSVYVGAALIIVASFLLLRQKKLPKLANE
jgi:S-adenosylmethionine uptake transporter